MKKVCMLTSEESFGNNYGAALQGYALYTTVKKLGYEPQIVRYRGGMPETIKDFSGIRKVKFVLGTWKRKIFVNESEREKRHHERKFKKQIAVRKEIFHRFAEDNFVYANNKPAIWWELKENPLIADLYLCGSDQIWNPYFKGGKNDLGYFLDFAPANKPRVAYAPSLGCSVLPAPAKSNFAQLISKFKAVSVREAAGQKIVKEETGLDVPVVADPTLLFTREDWEAVERKVEGVPEKYILCYRFSDNSNTKRSIDAISESLGLPVVTLPLSVPSLQDKNYRKVFNAGPAEFVWLIHHAELVCTDSFHATVFSLLFHTPFLTYMRENFSNSSANMNSRIENLLALAQLEHRGITEKQTCPDKEDLCRVDFSAFERNIEKLRKFSYEWLAEALKGDDCGA